MHKKHNNTCFKCNKPGHMAANCPSIPDKCFNCQQIGHMSKDCPKMGSHHGCFNCGKMGHFAKECPSPSNPKQELQKKAQPKKQLTDIEQQMLAAQAEKSASAEKKVQNKPSPNACYNCGKEGHIAMNCPAKGPQDTKCFNCGGKGHFSSNCPSSKKDAIADGGQKCYKCGKPGHIARQCSN